MPVQPQSLPRAVIAVIGDGSLPEDDQNGRAEIAREIGAGIIAAGHHLLSGGMGGVMEAASAGARAQLDQIAPERDGPQIIGVLPGHTRDEGNPSLTLPIATGLGHMRNQIVAHADAVIAIGGGAGTLSEIAFAWIHRRLVIGLACGGWSERLSGQSIDPRPRFADLSEDQVFAAHNAAEALELLARWLPRYRAALGG